MSKCTELTPAGRCDQEAAWTCSRGGPRCHQHSHISDCCTPVIEYREPRPARPRLLFSARKH